MSESRSSVPLILLATVAGLSLAAAGGICLAYVHRGDELARAEQAALDVGLALEQERDRVEQLAVLNETLRLRGERGEPEPEPEPAPTAARPPALSFTASDLIPTPADRVAELEGELERLTAKDRAQALELARARSERDQLQERIKHLVRKRTRTFEEASRPDGAVSEVEPDGSFVWIDLGLQHGLMAGTHFQVYEVLDDGRQRIKAMIAAEEPEPGRTRCRVLAEQQVVDPTTGETRTVPDPEHPVVRGDQLRNPFFDAARTRTFVFLGEQLTTEAHPLAEIQQTLEQFRARIASSVTIETDFVVLLPDGEEAHEDQVERALAFGVVFMDEEELLRYLGLEE